MSKIISLSEAATIGLHSMVLIARSQEGMNVQSIADLTASSRHHVAKIMQRLAKDNFLISTRGPSGGFVLKKKPTEINLLDIYECIEGKIEISSCPMDHQICAFDKCLMSNLTQTMTLQVREYLKSRTLESYI
ncbi:MAG: Rrf2 family transcriptional regulator [Paludibacteraceae bacterium]|nr:Rrf2 family transcriptional regulator [Paludibacteraceae bacterium]